MSADFIIFLHVCHLLDETMRALVFSCLRVRVPPSPPRTRSRVFPLHERVKYNRVNPQRETRISAQEEQFSMNDPAAATCASQPRLPWTTQQTRIQGMTAHQTRLKRADPQLIPRTNCLIAQNVKCGFIWDAFSSFTSQCDDACFYLGLKSKRARVKEQV